MTFKLILLTSALLLTACTVGPDYQKPRITPPANWRQPYQNHGAVIAAATSPLNHQDLPWWENFQDPVLTKLVKEAAGSNLDYKQALAKIKQARSSLSVAEAGFMPAILGKGLYTHNHPSKTVGQSSGGQQGDVFQVGLDVSWQLDLFGGLRRAAEEQKALEEASVAHGRAVLLTVISDVAQTYVTYRHAQNQMLLQQQILNVLEEQGRQQGDLARSGLTTITDQQQTRATRAQAEAALKEQDTACQTALYKLSVLLGKEPAALAPLLQSRMPIPSVKTGVFLGLPSTVLSQRPDIMEAERRLAASNAAVGVAVADLFPIFNLTGAFAFRGTSIHNVFSPKSSYVSAGPGVSLPIFSFGAIQAHIDGQKGLQEEALWGYKKTVLTALQDVESALVTFVNADAQVRLMGEAVDAGETTWRLANSRFQAGLDAAFSTHQARINLLNSQQKQLDAAALHASSAITLYKALGGGGVIIS